jgi:hypothetical protein
MSFVAPVAVPRHCDTLPAFATSSASSGVSVILPGFAASP